MALPLPCTSSSTFLSSKKKKGKQGKKENVSKPKLSKDCHQGQNDRKKKKKKKKKKVKMLLF